MIAPDSAAPGMVEMQLPITWRSLLRRMRDAAPENRRAIRGSVMTLSGVVGLAFFDSITGSAGQEPFRLAGAVLAAFGFTARVLAAVLWVPDSDAEQNNPSVRPVSAVPELNAIAAVLLGIAAGLFAPSVLQTPLFAVVPPVLLIFAFIAARDVMRATSALQRQALDLMLAGERSRSEAASARLAALQAQMNPHFLFNTLNTVASLIRTDARRAEHVVEDLSGVLRRTLDRSATPMGNVGDEIDFVRSYLRIEQERWGDALQVVWDVNDLTRNLPLPTMALQPLVENALIHGAGSRMEGGTVRIVVAQSGSDLSLSVSDDGPGFAQNFTENTGLGNLRRRIHEIYGSAASLDIRRESGFTVCALTLPARGPARRM